MATNAGNLVLRAARRDRGLSQREAAVGAAVAFKTLQRAERGEGEPHPANMKKIADFYGQKPSDIWPVDAREKAVA
jgi:transcriptional regulator with XRE-family HTH domain